MGGEEERWAQGGGAMGARGGALGAEAERWVPGGGVMGTGGRSAGHRGAQGPGWHRSPPAAPCAAVGPQTPSASNGQGRSGGRRRQAGSSGAGGEPCGPAARAEPAWGGEGVRAEPRGAPAPEPPSQHPTAPHREGARSGMDSTARQTSSASRYRRQRCEAPGRRGRAPLCSGNGAGALAPPGSPHQTCN